MNPRILVATVLVSTLSLTGASMAQPRSTSPEAMLGAAQRAQPWSRVAAARYLRSVGRRHESGLDGVWTLTSDLRSGRRAEWSDFGLFAKGQVFDGRRTWKIDPSGGVHPLDGAFSRRKAITDAWLATYGYLRPAAMGARLERSADTSDAGGRYAVIRATPAGGEPVDLWFDETTHLLAKVVRREPIRTVTVAYSDYRAVAGAQLPFRVAVHSDDGSEDTLTQVARYEQSATVAPGVFRKPSTRADFTLAHPTTVAAEVGTQVVIEARLNGKGPFSFILDTGAHSILTPDAVAALGLTAVGSDRSGGSGGDTVLKQDVSVKTVQIGDAALRDQHFYVLSLQYPTIERGRRAPLAGMLGLELFERFATSIDYRRQTVTLAPFSQSAAQCREAAVTLSFDDDMPLVEGRVDGRPGVLAVDTGNSGSTVIQGVWAAKVGLAERLRAGIETTSFGTGGPSTNWITHGGSLDIGGVHIPDVDLRYAQDSKGAFSSTTEAANVGQQILARFVVAFDYVHERMCLAFTPGYSPPPLNRSGMALAKASAQTFVVASVNRGSSAAAAGFKAGDVVTEVDGRPAADLSGADIFKILRGPPGSEVRLGVSGGGRVEQRRLVLAEPHP